MPERIQLKRTKGWRMPPNTVHVARPGKWGNPFKSSNRADDVLAFRQMIEGGAFLRQSLHELRGKDLACWCPLHQPCHADVLIEMANSE